jgi:hypothetical protein
MTKTMTRPDELQVPDRAADETARSALLRTVADLKAPEDSDASPPPRRWRRWPS